MDHASPFQGHPTLYWPVSSRREIVFAKFYGGHVTCTANDMGRPIDAVPADAVKFFRRTVTRFINAKGYENFSAHCIPNPFHRLHSFNNLQRRMLEVHQNGRYFINPAGVAWPYDDGDRVFHPDEFGLVIPPVAMRAVEE
jgi:hypothetical protein